MRPSSHPLKKQWRVSGGTAVVAACAMALASEAAHAQTPVALSSAPPLESREQAMQCLATAIVYEAANEPVEGQQAIAQVILNRSRSSLYPATICGVVYQGSERRTGCQFTFTCDGSLARRMPNGYFTAARLVAEAALDGALPDRVGQSLYYHAHYVMPRWAPQLDRVGRIGAHIFYQRPGTLDSGRRMLAQTTAALSPQPSIARQPFAPWGLAIANSRP